MKRWLGILKKPSGWVRVTEEYLFAERSEMILDSLLSLFSPSFDWIQVEVTSTCNAGCIYCPHTVYRTAWKDRHLPVEIFQRLTPAFSKTRHVHLQGWGEPFLHPDFFQFIEIAKTSGCRVGTTTNGMLLDEETIKRIVDSDLDLIAFSLAGTGPSNDAVRKGTRLDAVLKAMETLNREKAKRGISSPEIHVAYLLLRSCLSDLEKLPRLVADAGGNQIVVSTLDFIPSVELENEAFLKDSSGNDPMMLRLDEAVEQGEALGIGVHHYYAGTKPRECYCTENVGRAVCIASDGAVSPCVFTNLDVAGVEHTVGAQRRTYQRLIFGNIQEHPLQRIWKDKAYVRFRKSFMTQDLWPSCRGCLKLRGLYIAV